MTDLHGVDWGVRTEAVTFTQREILHLVDALRQKYEAPETYQFDVHALILKLAGPYTEFFPDGQERAGTATLHLTTKEVWALREHVSASHKQQDDAAFGRRLMTKLYAALLAFERPPLADAAPDADDKAMTPAQRESLRQLHATGDTDADAS